MSSSRTVRVTHIGGVDVHLQVQENTHGIYVVSRGGNVKRRNSRPLVRKSTTDKTTTVFEYRTGRAEIRYHTVEEVYACIFFFRFLTIRQYSSYNFKPKSDFERLLCARPEERLQLPTVSQTQYVRINSVPRTTTVLPVGLKRN